MSYFEYDYNVYGDRKFTSVGSALYHRHPYNFPEEQIPTFDHIHSHQSAPQHYYQDRAPSGYTGRPALHPPSSASPMPNNWLYIDRKPNLTFPTPAHVYGQYQKASNPYGPHTSMDSLGIHRTTLAGSLDPNTGIFYRTPEHPRLRTAQACEKCRTRKAKCSGEHPSCKRCINRNLVCEYAKEGRIRGPNKPKLKSVGSQEDMPLREAQPGTSRDGTPTHVGTPGSATVEPDHGILVGVHEAEVPIPFDNPTTTSFAEHRPLRSRPSDLQVRLGPEGQSPTTALRRSRNDLYSALYSTTPLQSPTSPTPMTTRESMPNHDLFPYSEQRPDMPCGGQFHTSPETSFYDGSTFSSSGGQMCQIPSHGYLNPAYDDSYRAIATNFDYHTPIPGLTPGTPPAPHNFGSTGHGSVDQTSVPQNTQEVFIPPTGWATPSSHYPYM